MSSRRPIILVLSLILISCGNKNNIPTGVLKPDEMRGVLWDVMLADAFTQQQIKTYTSAVAQEENAKLQKQVFGTHNITKEVFYKSLDYYKAHPNLMKTLLDSVIVKANRDKVSNIIIKPSLDSLR